MLNIGVFLTSLEFAQKIILVAWNNIIILDIGQWTKPKMFNLPCTSDGVPCLTLSGLWEWPQNRPPRLYPVYGNDIWPKFSIYIRIAANLRPKIRNFIRTLERPTSGFSGGPGKIYIAAKKLNLAKKKQAKANYLDLETFSFCFVIIGYTCICINKHKLAKGSEGTLMRSSRVLSDKRSDRERMQVCGTAPLNLTLLRVSLNRLICDQVFWAFFAKDISGCHRGQTHHQNA